MNGSSLPPAQELALAHSGTDVRPLLDVFFELDARLGQFVSQAKEPILTQMRIAWWRDQFGKPAKERPKGDPVLDRLTQSWSGEERALMALVNGWEALLADPPLPPDSVVDFASGRGACFAAIGRLIGEDSLADDADRVGRLWGMADLATRMSTSEERDFVIEQARAIKPAEAALPYKLRALTILERLARNVIVNNQPTLISGRKDLLTVMRLGLFGK